jgi:hypothetical protein
MKWFKHHSSLRNSEVVAKILDKGGIEAYGAFCMVCELVAENMTASDIACTLTLPSGRWVKELGMHRNRVARLLSILGASGMVETSKVEGGFKVAIPILAEWRDEYSKKSGHTQESIRTNSSRSDQIRTEKKRSEQRRSAGILAVATDDEKGREPDAILTNTESASEEVLEVMRKMERAGFVK